MLDFGVSKEDLLAVEQAFQSEHATYYDCVYTPLTTARLLLSQALDPDPSLRQAVNRASMW